MSGSSSFTPSTLIDPAKERDWPAQLGMLDWDTTNVVFTKRTLLEFLKLRTYRYAGVTVDTNFTNIQKLPRYAQFGKFAGTSPSEVGAASTNVVASPSASSTAASDFKPTRRVREAPGGFTHDIFGSSADDDALARAPPNPSSGAIQEAQVLAVEANRDSEDAPAPAPAQQRKKSNNSSGIASLWDAPDESGAFKPTRRVREMPGGKDSISGLF
ncbi:hypothetical protein GSI_07158 [Ganoderma sinense ZZ0214-1]|uniref:Uncharacterized protein n=1 Tax=Ganoderma sinense ZZ0214-1 TaxID=1077348 RepID=A0A2G8S9N1_9APHY|nr:hypothetical protein GSI_07158 [Ganoderma sinense ZZ0214-1]